MDTDKFRNFIAIGLILYACVNVLMKFMPNIATQLPLPVYEFFYSITVNTEPSPPEVKLFMIMKNSTKGNNNFKLSPSLSSNEIPMLV